ncbi:MAG TPA: DNA-directed RNA polymerase subunit beta, partial [Clostridiaceae bacterium]|nr:DNA-directed RNA polymerase subunit beta [Clostridiaceae bacterium]
MSYSKIDEILDIPDLLEIQKSSYKWFIEEGLMEVLRESSPITDFSGDFELSFIDRKIDIDSPTYAIEECKERDANYAAKLYMDVQLRNRVTDEIRTQEVYIGEFPLMTDTGSFIINGAERVIISQLVRSPGAYFDIIRDKNDVELYTAQVIPNRGAWIEFESDAKRILWVRVDRQRKFHLTILLRALGLGTDQEIIDALGTEESLLMTMQKDGCKTSDEGLQELFRKLRPGEVYTREGAQALIHNNFFQPSRYDLAKVGIYKLNKKLAIAERLAGHVAASDIIAEDGELLVLSGEIITRESAEAIQQAGINVVDVFPIYRIGDTVTQFDHQLRIVGNERVRAENYLSRFFGSEVADSLDFSALGIHEAVYTPVLREIVEEAQAAEDPAEFIRLQFVLR